MPPPAPPDRPLAGQHAIVTGASRGIGLAIATHLAGLGAQLTLMARDQARIAALAASLPDARAIECDLTRPDAVTRAFAAAAEAGPVSILVNNAGVADSAPFLKTDRAALERIFALNLFAVFQCIQSVLPAMLVAGYGRIVNVASTAGLVGYAYTTAYSASKHAVIGLTRSLALETARKGVTVNAVCPGYTNTDIVRQAIANIRAKTGRSEAEAAGELTGHNPQGRLVEPEEVAAAIGWLCLVSSGSITGQSIAVAGGEVM